MGAAIDREPIGEFIVVGVRVVEETTFLDDEPARVLARPIATIPAKRALADGARNRFHCPANVLPLLFQAQLLMPDPAPPVRANIEPGSADRRAGGRVA